MGAIFSSIFQRLWGTKEVRILILGIDGAGKTTILYRLQIGEVVTTIPTIGFNVETVTHRNIKFQVWDLGGQTSIRPYWRCYYQNTDAVIYVIDSTDRERLAVSKDELLSMLGEEELRTAKLLVLANKQDLGNAMSAAEVSEHLGLTELRGRTWTIFKCSALTGEGLNESLDWLATQVHGGSGGSSAVASGAAPAGGSAMVTAPSAVPMASPGTTASVAVSEK